MKQIIIILLVITGSIVSCKKQLEVGNPNVPTIDKANTESGIIALTQGGTYINGFQQGTEDVTGNYYDGVSGHFWSGAIGFEEIMADVIGAEAANQFLNQLGVPNYVILDNGTKILNPNSPKEQIAFVREVNTNANLGQNFEYHEWAYMYGLNKSCNRILALVDQVSFMGNADVKKNAIKAWCYWWKGFAYARIGSIYYAGLINDADQGTNGDYVTKEQMIDASNANLDKAAAILQAITGGGDYQEIIGKIIPSIFQVGKGGVPTPQMWLRNINTLKARNILVNTPLASMSSAQWASILTLVNDGIQVTDNVFTGRSSADFLTSGTASIKATSDSAGGGTYKISERLIQEYKLGDKRLANNFLKTTTWIGNSDRGNVFNTRYALISGGRGLAGVTVLSNSNTGEYELYMAGTYEENELMKAEAKINSGDINGGLTFIDAVRTYQGAGLAAVSGTGLTLAQAQEEIRRERRVVLPFRGISFYDARRWGVINPIAQGGGRTGAVVVDGGGILSTNATIEYNFLDYWDVPDNELAYNPPAAGSAPVKNPK